MDAAVRHGTIRLWNKEHDVSGAVRAAVQETEGKIAREVERRLGSASTLSAVVFVGGGGALFGTIAERFPNGVMADDPRSEEHTSELQSLMRNSYAVFCL